MNPRGYESIRVGKKAEQRVRDLASQLGFSVTGSPELDYGAKTDVVVAGIPVQVSCYPKSNGAQERLAKRGIFNIAASEDYTDVEVITAILQAVNYES